MEERGRCCDVHFHLWNWQSSGVVDESKNQTFADRKGILLRLLLLARRQKVLSTGGVARISSVVVDEGRGRATGIDSTCSNLV